MNEKFNYEKNNTITTLKNEIEGITQLLKILKVLKKVNYGKLEKKVINKKLIDFLNLKAKTYFYNESSYSNDKINISFMVYNKYNEETKSYIDYYRSYTLNIFVTIDEKFKQRFSTESFLIEIESSITSLNNRLKELLKELNNIDETIKDYEVLHKKMVEFKKERTSFFKDNFKELNNFY